MGFVDNLRINSIYPVSGTAPDVSVSNQGPNLARFMSQFSANVAPFLEQNAYNQRAHMLQDRNSAIEQQQLADLNKRQAGITGMNTVLSGITPYQQAGLDLKNRELEDKIQGGDEQRQLLQDKLDAMKENNQGNLGIRQQRANTYDYKATHPDQKFLPVKGGDYMTGNPQTGVLSDSGVDTGTMSDSDRQAAQFAQALQLLQGRNANSLQLQDLRNQGALAQIGARVANRPVQQPRALLPSQENTQAVFNAHKLFNTNPDWTQYLKFDETGSPIIDQNAPPAIRKQMMDQIYGSSTPSSNSGGSSNNDPLGLNLGGGGQ